MRVSGVDSLGYCLESIGGNKGSQYFVYWRAVREDCSSSSQVRRPGTLGELTVGYAVRVLM